MLITEQNLTIWYNEYKKQYKKSEKFVKSRSGRTRELPMLSKTEFDMDFRAEVYDNPKASGKEIAQKMAKQDVYGQTAKQARKQAEAYVEMFGGHVTGDLINRFRAQSMTEFFDIIEARREELKNSGLASSTVKIMIGQEFFGSE